ncbi:hypothetical protein WAI453_013099 [Rhynchosporium graminicola]
MILALTRGESSPSFTGWLSEKALLMAFGGKNPRYIGRIHIMALKLSPADASCTKHLLSLPLSASDDSMFRRVRSTLGLIRAH